MGRKYTISDQSQIHFVTFTIIDWLKVFDDPQHCRIFIKSVKYCQKQKGLEVYAWCIMPNHVHMIIGKTGNKNIQDIVRDLKSYTSRKIRMNLEDNAETDLAPNNILKHLKNVAVRNNRKTNFQLWQYHYHPVELSTNKMMEQRLEYIHHNPVSAGLTDVPEHWKWSSAIDYYGSKGLIDIIFIS